MTKQSLDDQITIDYIVDTINLYSWTWPIVKDKLTEMIVDKMPAQVLIRLTDDPEGFKEAENILLDFYFPKDMHTRIISDAFDICGQEETLYALEGLKLDEVTKPDVSQDENT